MARNADILTAVCGAWRSC